MGDIEVMDRPTLRDTTGMICVDEDGFGERDLATAIYRAVSSTDSARAAKMLEENGRWYIWWRPA